MSYVDGRNHMIYAKIEIPAPKPSRRAEKQRALIALKIVSPPPAKRIFGPPEPADMNWDNAALQQRYLHIAHYPVLVSEHEAAYNVWRIGHPAEPVWKALNLQERAHWAGFYLNFKKLSVKDGVEIDDKETNVKDREEYRGFYKEMFKRTFVPEPKKVEKKKRQKVYDVNGTFIGWLNRELEPQEKEKEKEKSNKDRVLHGRIKKEPGVKAKQYEESKQYGPEDAVPKRGPWRPVKALGPAANDNMIESPLPSSPSRNTRPVNDSMIDPALRALGRPPRASSHTVVPNTPEIKLEPNNEYSQVSNPSLQMQPPPIPANPFQGTPPRVEHVYSQWLQSPRPNHPQRYGFSSPSGTRTLLGNGDTSSSQAPNMQTTPLPRPRMAKRSPPPVQSPQQGVQQPDFGMQSPQRAVQHRQSSPERYYHPYILPTEPQPENFQLVNNKARLDANGYMLKPALRDLYESPYAAGGSNKGDSAAKKE